MAEAVDRVAADDLHDAVGDLPKPISYDTRIGVIEAYCGARR